LFFFRLRILSLWSYLNQISHHFVMFGLANFVLQNVVPIFSK